MHNVKTNKSNNNETEDKIISWFIFFTWLYLFYQIFMINLKTLLRILMTDYLFLV